ncbi:cilia- and flagella-associated protein 300-like [Diadema setosum]|uniref:cilia- and flagella-associated protein 300-like n=1 Tax=Diadema setosum TaxID=31175 RepID=UPI003B3B2450
MASSDVNKREKKFNFMNIDAKECQTLKNADVKDLLMKWGMKGRYCVQYFSYDQLFQVYQKDDFMLDFFQDPVVMATLQVLSDSGTWGPTGFTAEKVEATPIPCSVTSMNFFDRLEEEGLVREGGRIVKCFDEFYEDFTISDEVRKMILLEDSDNYEIYSDTEREQFLFLLFQHLCLGGAVCQYEDSITPYLDTTKSLYKELVSVQKDPSTKELRITSSVFKVKAWDKDDYQFYPSDKDHRQTFAYFVIDPLKRHVTVFYHLFGSGIFT